MTGRFLSMHILNMSKEENVFLIKNHLLYINFNINTSIVEKNDTLFIRV